jgi:hypothetical protein
MIFVWARAEPFFLLIFTNISALEKEKKEKENKTSQRQLPFLEEEEEEEVESREPYSCRDCLFKGILSVL